MAYLGGWIPPPMKTHPLSFAPAMLMAAVLTTASVSAQNQPEAPPTDEQLQAVFRLGTFIGASYQKISSIGVFGELTTTSPLIGRYSLPYKLEYASGLDHSPNAFRTEIGLFQKTEY